MDIHFAMILFSDTCFGILASGLKATDGFFRFYCAACGVISALSVIIVHLNKSAALLAEILLKLQ
jgi:hypothetical protein